MSTITLCLKYAQMWDNELAAVSLGALLLGLRTFNLPKEQRSYACICVHMHLSLHEPLDILNDLPQPHDSRFACHAALHNIF